MQCLDKPVENEIATVPNSITKGASFIKFCVIKPI